MASTQRNGTGVSAEFAQTNGNTPSAPTDIANKAYVDAATAGASAVGYYYGGGVDSSLTLVADTNLAQGKNVRQYSSIALAGFTFGITSTDAWFFLMCSGTISLGGGTIQTRNTSAASPGGGIGGAAGFGRNSLFVYANAFTGTGFVSSAGTDGVAGQNGVLSGSGGGGNGTTTSASLLVASGNLGNFSGGSGSGSLDATTGGIGGAGVTVTRSDAFLSLLKDLFRIMWISDTNQNTSSVRCYQSCPGGSGGGATARANGNAADKGAGAGGGGPGLVGDSGAGGNGTNGSGTFNAAGGGQAGGAGGGGGGGCLVVCFTGSAPSTLTVTAKGGDGGHGGNGVSAGGGVSGAGGGGGGGGGGIAIMIAQAGNTATCTAAKGNGGVAGNNSSGVLGNSGGDGTAGWAISMVK
jgi:hypothetical protein